MKTKSLQALLFSILMSGTFAFAQGNPQNPSGQAEPAKEVQVGVNEAFVPAGFDSNAEAYVVVSGLFANGCYTWSRGEVKNVTDFEHEITTFASVNPGMCIMVLVPYQKEIRLGRLAQGKHTLRFIGADSTYLEKTFEVQ